MIRRMSVENQLWGAPRIHGELFKLGIEVAQIKRHAVRSVVRCAVDWIARHGARADKPGRTEVVGDSGADVAGYSRLIHDDEEATHAKLRALLV